MATFSYGNLDASPEDAGYSKERLDLLGSHVGAMVDTGRVQAAGFLCARGGKVFAHQAAGRLTFRDDSPAVTADSIKRIASITKLFTATAVMQLVEDGKLWLGQPVKEIIPEFDNAMYGGISIWHLLTHTSGLPADPGYYLEPYPVDWFRDKLQREDWIKEILAGPIQNQPGTRWNYCTNGYLLLGEIISRVSGSHFDEYVVRSIFKPLGLTRTFMNVPEELRGNVCVGDEQALASLQSGTVRPAGFPPMSGGGVYSTMYDLFRFGQCFLQGGTFDGIRIIGRKTAETMMRNQLESVPSFHWGTNCKTYRHGLGWGFYTDGSTVSPSCVNHDGWGWATLFVDPEEDFVYVHFFADNNEWDPKVMVSTRTIAFSGII